MPSKLLSKEYRTTERIAGSLVALDHVKGVGNREMANITLANGETLLGQVLELDGERAILQVFGSTQGVDLARTSVVFTGDVARLVVSLDLLGRVLDGTGAPIDGGPAIAADQRLDINGLIINPYAREEPSDFIQTGLSAIDGLNSLVRGQKLPIFSGFGLPANEIAAQIATQAKVRSGERFVVVFAAMGVTHREASFFLRTFESSGALERVVVFLNLAGDPAIQRLLTPRCALTAAEYLAFTYDMHVLVIMTDMTNYCEALREISTARDEIPGRRGYPGYMYTDLASIYERAGRVKGRAGSITQLPILSMPDDDMTHPIPDLTGYITEGQIVLSRDLHRRGVYPPIDALPCLSRLMNMGIGRGKTREDHRNLADQLYAAYARGRDLRRLVAIVGEAALSDLEREYLIFAAEFESRFIGQGHEDRTLEGTLGLGWEMASRFPASELIRIAPEFIARYYHRIEGDGGGATPGPADIVAGAQAPTASSTPEKAGTAAPAHSAKA